MAPEDQDTQTNDSSASETLEGNDTDKKEKDAPTAEELQAELEKTRAALKKANSEAAERRVKLQEYEEAERKRKEAELSEVEKAQQAAKEAQERYDRAVAEMDTLRMRQAFYDAVEAAEVAFTSPQARQDAFDLSELAEVEISDDGKVTGMDKVIKALQEERPYLFGAKREPPDIDANKRGGKKTDEARLAEAARKYGIEQ